MSTILLDTSAISFFIKNDERGKDYMPLVEGHTLAISFMTVAELFQWAEFRHWGQHRIQQLELTLQNYLLIPFDINLCRRWARVRATARASGRPISSQDAWIAATALEYAISLATHNSKDFEVLEDLHLLTTLPIS